MPYTPYLCYGYVYYSNGLIVSKAKLVVTTSISTKIYSTNSDGLFMYDLAEIGYVTSEIVSVIVTEPYNNELKEHTFVVSGFALNEDITLSQRTEGVNVTGYSPRTILHSVGNKPITADNPLPINNVTKVSQNISITYTYDVSDNLIYIDKTIDGVTYRQTLTYDGTNLATVSGWVKQ